VETQTKTKTKHAVRAERKEKLLMLVHHGGDGGDVDGDGGDVDGDGGPPLVVGQQSTIDKSWTEPQETHKSQIQS